MSSAENTESTSDFDIILSLNKVTLSNDKTNTEYYDVTDTTTYESTESDKQDSILCFVWKCGKLGSAYYKITDKQLHMYDDIMDALPGLSATRTILHQINPLQVCVFGSMMDEFVKHLIDILTEDETIESDQSRKIPSILSLLSFKDYSFQACEYKIHNLRLPTEPDDSNEEERNNYLQTLIDFQNKCSIHALGALIKYTESNWGHFNPTCSEDLKFTHINAVTMKNQVRIDKNTYNALQIFKIESHDSSFKHGGEQSTREGISIFKLLSQHCKSNLGFFHLRKMLLSPTNDILELNTRMDFIQFAINPSNTGYIESLHDNIKRISDVNAILPRIQYARGSSSDWERLYKTIYHTLFMREICNPHKNASILLAELDRSITNNLYGLQKCIDNALDFKNNFKRKRPVVKFGLDEELDAKKLKRQNVCKTVTTAANFTVNQLPEYLNECIVVYVPASGYLVAVKEWEPNCNWHQLEEIGFQFMFELKGVLHYKNAMCKELDKQLGDIHLDIIAHENRIISRLAGFVLKYDRNIREPLQIIAMLDSLISMAKVAKEKGYIRPQLNEDNVHEIQECRHPLMEVFCSNFVCNDFFSGGSHSRMKIITGPNASGKTVFLKQIGLIIYMAHIGSFIPAKTANIGLMTSFHTRIHASESAAVRLSAFLIDLTQMAQALNNAQANSLVIVDEFGRGTTGTEGFALHVGALRKFLKDPENCAHILVSTHMQKLASRFPPSDLISHMQLNHMKQNNEMVYLYKLIPGVSTSFAFEVATTAELDNDLIKRSLEILHAFKNNQCIQPIPQMNEKYDVSSEVKEDEFLIDITVPAPDE